MPSSGPPTGIAETLLFAGSVLLRQHAICGLPASAHEMPVVYIPALCPQDTSPFDFSHTGELMDGAYGSTKSFLGRLEVRGPGLYGSPHVHDADEGVSS